MNLPEIFAAVLRASCLGGAGVLLLLMARWMAGRALAPAWRCWLWLPVAALFVMPRLPDLGLDRKKESLPVVVREMIALPSHPADLVVHSVLEPVTFSGTAPAPQVAPFSWLEKLAFAWISGCVALLALWLSSYGWLMRRVRRGGKSAPESLRVLLAECAREAGLRRMPRLVVTDALDNPAVAGLLRPMVLVPERLPAMLEEPELRFVLQHEVWHVKRRDLWFHWCSALLLAAHWFNPLFWIAARLFRADREAACDAAVLATCHGDGRGPYGDTLLKLQARFSRALFLRPIVGVLGGTDLLKARIIDIVNFGRGSRLAGGFGMIFILAAVAGLAVFAGEPAKEEAPVVIVPGPSSLPAPIKEGMKPDRAKNEEMKKQAVLHSIDALAGVVPLQIHVTSRFISFEASQDMSSPLNWFASPPVADVPDRALVAKGAPVSTRPMLVHIGVFSDPQFQTIMRALFPGASTSSGSPDAKKITNDPSPQPWTAAFKNVVKLGHPRMASAPSVTTRSGQRATVEVVREFIYPTAYERKESQEPAGNPTLAPSSFAMQPLGIRMEVEPIAYPEGTVALHISPQITAFLKWQDFKAADGQLLRNPIFGSTACNSNVTIGDGQTVAFGGYAYQAAFLGTDIKKLTENPPGDALCPVLVFVTAKLIDPTGRLAPPKTGGNRGIVIPLVKLSDVTLADAVSKICDLARKNDPRKKGINVILRHPAREPARITLDTADVTLSGVLGLLATIAHLDLQVEGETVLLVPKKE